MVVRLAKDLEEERKAAIAEAEEHIRAAVQKIKPLGIAYNRIAWILEDTLGCLMEADNEEEFDETVDFSDELDLEKQQENS